MSSDIIEIDAAPTITMEAIIENIVGEEYYNFPTTTVTICLLTLKNGFNVVGESACVSPENFDENKGREVAYENARDKIWALMGYQLMTTLNDAQQYAQNVPPSFTNNKEKTLR